MRTVLAFVAGIVFIGIGINRVRSDHSRGRRLFLSPGPLLWIGLGTSMFGVLVPALYGAFVVFAFVGLVVSAVQQRREGRASMHDVR